jgi:hypothetical protein
MNINEIIILGFAVLIGGLFYKYVDALIEVEKENKEFNDD